MLACKSRAVFLFGWIVFLLKRNEVVIKVDCFLFSILPTVSYYIYRRLIRKSIELF